MAKYTIDFSPKPKRNKRIYELKLKGLSLREIARSQGISYERVRQICNEQAKKESYAQDEKKQVLTA